jgi:SAM-dependent methyltransferase
MMRDTDEDWRHYGAFEPYYGVLTHERFLRANLNAEALEEFWQTGRADVQRSWSQLTKLFGDREPRSALDFGCGVGRLTRAMAEIAERAVGVDISPEMIAEGQLNALPANVELTTEVPDGPFDWINSFIVFQHIPPVRGYELFESLLSRAAVDCFLSVHFTFFKDGRGLSDHGLDAMRFGTWDGEVIRPIVKNERDRTMMMYDYDLTRLYAMLVAHRFTDVHLVHTDHAGAHGAFILAAR